MEPAQSDSLQTPPDCFQLHELETLQAAEGAQLTDVNYYLWLNENEETPYRFLFFLELVFDDQPALLLSSGEDSQALRVSDAENLVRTADALRHLNGRITLQKLNAGASPLWENVVGKNLEAVQLSKHENGLYRNDALLLDFGRKKILVEIGEQEGLHLYIYA